MLKQIVVVGGGAGGLELVVRLGKKLGKKGMAQITLVDVSPIHIWKPLLHEKACGTLNAPEDEINYLYFSSDHHYRFRLGALQMINRKEKTIQVGAVHNENGEQLLPPRTIPYDVLVLAIGSVSNDFRVPGVKENCLFIDSCADAANFQKCLSEGLFKSRDAVSYEIGIVGGGATGVELSAELHYAIQLLSNFKYNFDPQKYHISIIEGSNGLLAGLNPRVANNTQLKLEALGIKVYTNQQVTEVTDKAFLTATGLTIKADLKIWAAGIKAPDCLVAIDDLEKNKINQLIVTDTLQTTLDPSIFALGDCAFLLDKKTQKPVPARAQSAHQQASLLAKSIPLFLDGQTSLPKYQYRDYGSLISISHYDTFGNLMKRGMIEGRIAHWMYLSLYKMHQIAIFGWWRSTIIMIANFLTQRLRPRLKLH